MDTGVRGILRPWLKQIFFSKSINFLVACTRLYKPLCRSVGPSVGKRLLGARDLWQSALFFI